MATKIVLLLVCSFLVIIPRAAGTAVLDGDGDEVRSGQLYHAMSVMILPGGVLGLVARNDSCPLFVGQVRSGQPVALFPENPNDDIVEEGRTLYVMFPQPTNCSESTVWKVDGATGYVTTGGTTSAAIGPHNSRFAIRKVGESDPTYQIDVCPCSMGADRPACFLPCTGTLGLVKDPAVTYPLLGVNTNQPRTIAFTKVKPQETSMIRSAVVRPN